MENHKILDFIAANIKVLFGIVAAVLLGIGGAALWNEKAQQQSAAASELLFQVQKEAEPLITQKNYPEATKKFSIIAEKFPGSRAHYESELLLGDIWMDAANYQEAVAHYEKAINLGSDSFSKTLASYNAGIASESAGKYQDAVSRYEAALKDKNADFLRPEILMAQARCHEMLNEKDKAIALYQQIQDKFASRTYYSGAASAMEKQLTKSM
jgi:tetratricopeptide (TPR) repeat protein